MAKFFFSRRTRTQDFMTKNGKVFLRSRTQDFMTEYDKVFFLGEVVPNIGGYKFSRRTRTLILLSTISPGEVVPRYDFSRRNRTRVNDFSRRNHTQFLGYEFSWVRLLLGTTSPATQETRGLFSRANARDCSHALDSKL
jgi:hypothetical protein